MHKILGFISGKKWPQHLAFLLISGVIALVFIGSLLNKGPMNTHLWRQTDCLSMTQNMANGNGLFEPEMHIQLANDLQSGKSAGEIPLLYWTVGQFWKFTGESMFIYRFFYLIIILIGVYALYLSIRPFIASYFWSVTLGLSLFFAPVYLYYGVSFLTDGPAFSFSLIAIFFLIRYILTYRKLNFWLAMGFFTLVGLLKVSSLIPFVFVIALFGLEFLGVKLLKSRKIFQFNVQEFAGFFTVFVLLIGWYSYASYYNNLHAFKYTFNHIFPFWLTDQYELNALLLQIRDLSQPVFLSKWTLLMLGLIWVFNLVRIRKTPFVLWLMNLLIPIGVAIYVALWFPLFGVHDYYYMPLVVLIPAVLIPFVIDLQLHFITIFHHKATKILVITFVTWNFIYAHEVHALKKGIYRNETNLVLNNPNFVNVMNWTNWQVYDQTYQFFRLREELEAFDIRTSDKVIILSDDSFNISLFLIGRRGWTNFKQYTSASDIENLRDKGGAKHLLLFEKDVDRFSFVNELDLQATGQFENILIFSF
jgi:hypothetical protein